LSNNPKRRGGACWDAISCLIPNLWTTKVRTSISFSSIRYRFWRLEFEICEVFM
jgi:hypothetical protein